MIEGGPDPWDREPSPKPPKRWKITRKVRYALLRIKDQLIYQTGAYPDLGFSWRGFAEGMLQRPHRGKKYTKRWDALFGRWRNL